MEGQYLRVGQGLVYSSGHGGEVDARIWQGVSSMAQDTAD